MSVSSADIPQQRRQSADDIRPTPVARCRQMNEKTAELASRHQVA